jgi:hypothetical protein
MRSCYRITAALAASILAVSVSFGAIGSQNSIHAPMLIAGPKFEVYPRFRLDVATGTILARARVRARRTASAITVRVGLA